MRALVPQQRSRMRPLVARATAWLLDPPAEPTGLRERPAPPPEPSSPPRLALAPGGALPPDPLRPVVAVLGLAPRAGVSTIARALAAQLAAGDPSGTAILFTADPPRSALPTSAAARLARAAMASGIEAARASGRLCLVPSGDPLAPLAAQRPAPIVADVPHGTLGEGTVALADHVVLVGPAEVELALAAAVEMALRAGGHSVSLVLNRAVEPVAPELEHAILMPESRMAARLTLACRPPRGPLGAVAEELAERGLAEVIS